EKRGVWNVFHSFSLPSGQISEIVALPAIEPGPTMPPIKSEFEKALSRLAMRALLAVRAELKLASLVVLVTSVCCALRKSHGATGLASCQSPRFSSRAICSHRA